MTCLSLPLATPATAGTTRCPLPQFLALPHFRALGALLSLLDASFTFSLQGSASSPLQAGIILDHSSSCLPWSTHHVSPTGRKLIFLGRITRPPFYGVSQHAPPSQRMWQKPGQSGPSLWNLIPDGWAFEFSTTAKQLEQIYLKRERPLAVVLLTVFPPLLSPLVLPISLLSLHALLLLLFGEFSLPSPSLPSSSVSVLCTQRTRLRLSTTLLLRAPSSSHLSSAQYKYLMND